MGTFHQNKGELHGITVIVDTTAPRSSWAGATTWTTAASSSTTPTSIATATSGRSKEDYVTRVAQLGFWKKHDHLMIPQRQDRLRAAARRDLGSTGEHR